MYKCVLCGISSTSDNISYISNLCYNCDWKIEADLFIDSNYKDKNVLINWRNMFKHEFIPYSDYYCDCGIEKSKNFKKCFKCSNIFDG